jgi:hypothetical protein
VSNREYFSLKYAVPGFTLILIVGAINYIPLLWLFGESSAKEIPDLFLAVLTLFGGSALGFLVSQIWWLYFEKFGRSKFYSTFHHILKRKYNIAINEVLKVMAVFDHVVHHEEGKELSVLSSRRWDLYHLLSATMTTLLIGSLLGIICRAYYQVTHFGFQFSLEGAFESGEFLVLGIVFVSVTLLLIFLDELRGFARDEYEKFAQIRILKSPIKREKLGQVLTVDYYDFGDGFKDSEELIDTLAKKGITASEVKNLNSNELINQTGITKEEDINKLKKLKEKVNTILAEQKNSQISQGI